MKSARIVFLILASGLLAGTAAAQMATGMRGSASKEGQAEKGMMAGGMMKECQAMMAEREDMMSKMKAMDEKLDQLVAGMDAADGDHKIGAMAAVIEELVAQRKAMREMSMKMEGRTMGHMMEHMRAGKMDPTAMCPMMEMAAKAPKPVKTDKVDHAGHH